MNEPVFVVVGNVNRGKSSVVATLAADDSVDIGPLPGTTRVCRSFPMQVGDRTLYTLVDSPGFERPRQALAWMTQRAEATVDRRAAVEAFVREHGSTAEYRQECELLRPILDGG